MTAPSARDRRTDDHTPTANPGHLGQDQPSGPPSTTHLLIPIQPRLETVLERDDDIPHSQRFQHLVLLVPITILVFLQGSA